MIGVMRRFLWRTVWAGICELVDDTSSPVSRFAQWAEARYGLGSELNLHALLWLLYTDGEHLEGKP